VLRTSARDLPASVILMRRADKPRLTTFSTINYDSGATIPAAVAAKNRAPIRDGREPLAMDTSSTASVRRAASSMPAGTRLHCKQCGVEYAVRWRNAAKKSKTNHIQQSVRFTFSVLVLPGSLASYRRSDHERHHQYELRWPATGQ
jgi:hypothetical protein